MERPNKGLSLSALAAGMSRMMGGTAASMMAFTDAMMRESPSVTRQGRIGAGRRSILTQHRKIRADAERDTPGAQRMREVVARRAANWQK